MLESFLQAQKVSVRKTLQRSFRKYVTYGEDCNLLLMHQLQNLFADMERYNTVSGVHNLFVYYVFKRSFELDKRGTVYLHCYICTKFL